jgi:hypothetical protein
MEEVTHSEAEHRPQLLCTCTPHSATAAAPCIVGVVTNLYIMVMMMMLLLLLSSLIYRWQRGGDIDEQCCRHG